MPEFRVHPGDILTLEFNSTQTINIPEDIARVVHQQAPRPVHFEEMARGAYIGPDGRARELREQVREWNNRRIGPEPFEYRYRDYFPPPRRTRPVAKPIPPEPEDPFSMDA